MHHGSRGPGGTWQPGVSGGAALRPEEEAPSRQGLREGGGTQWASGEGAGPSTHHRGAGGQGRDRPGAHRAASEPGEEPAGDSGHTCGGAGLRWDPAVPSCAWRAGYQQLRRVCGRHRVATRTWLSLYRLSLPVLHSRGPHLGVGDGFGALITNRPRCLGPATLSQKDEAGAAAGESVERPGGPR